MNAGLRFGFLAVPILWVLIANVGPLVAMAGISGLETYPGPRGAEAGFSLHAYASFAESAGFQASLARSLALAGAATFAALLISYPLAYHVALHVPGHLRARRLLLLMAPFWTSEVLRVFALVLLLANRGAFNMLLRWTGITSSPVALLYGNGSVLAGMTYLVLLSMLLPVYAAFERLPREPLDAALNLGASGWQRFWWVILPLTMRGLGSGIILTFLASLGAFTVPALLGGAGTPVFASVIGDLFGAASGRWPMGAAFGLILLAAGTALAAVVTGVVHRLTRWDRGR